MVRAFFLAIGFCLIIVGAECLGLDTVVLKIRGEPTPRTTLMEDSPSLGPKKSFSPPEWLPWSLMGSGAVVCIYSFTIPSRVKG